MWIEIEYGEAIAVPMCGPIHAGFPSPAHDITKHDIDLNAYLIKKPVSTFLLQIKGNSMSGVGIMDGDYVIVDRGNKNAREGEIVVAMVDSRDAFTIKTLRTDNEGNKYLQPENPDFMNIYPEESLEICGKVVGCFRSIT